MNKILKAIICVTVLFTASTSMFAASKKSIVCTTYPEYDWILSILGEKSSEFDITLLQNNGTDMHSYQPSVKDIAKISKADLFVYVGGESDKWAGKILVQAANKNQIAFNMMEKLGDKIQEEEIVEGMQSEEEPEDEPEYDEHIWLSLNNAMLLTAELSSVIQKIDQQNARIYKENTEAYITLLSALNEEYKAAVKSAKKGTILFGDRFPFRYLTEDYGLKYYAAFAGCSAESEASFETIVFLAKKVDELGLNSVITIEKSDIKIARTIVSTTKNKNQQILEMDSLQSVTQTDIKNGRNYISVMNKNLEVLKKALN